MKIQSPSYRKPLNKIYDKLFNESLKELVKVSKIKDQEQKEELQRQLKLKLFRLRRLVPHCEFPNKKIIISSISDILKKIEKGKSII
ncbi:MAG: hypothetical protein V1824_00980 [archaeon]